MSLQLHPFTQGTSSASLPPLFFYAAGLAPRWGWYFGPSSPQADGTLGQPLYFYRAAFLGLPLPPVLLDLEAPVELQVGRADAMLSAGYEACEWGGSCWRPVTAAAEAAL